MHSLNRVSFLQLANLTDFLRSDTSFDCKDKLVGLVDAVSNEQEMIEDKQ